MIRKSKTITIEQLLDRVVNYHPRADQDLIKKAYNFALQHHKDQKRLSGDSVITHGLAVAGIVADWRLDSISIGAGLLHDVIEDTPAKIDTIKKQFGKEMASLVDGLTRVSRVRLRGSNNEQFIENLRKMFLAMSRDLRVVFVKLADRYHNMETLEHLPPDKQFGIAEETLEVYAPLAERLGMGQVKGELEDLAFMYCFPADYEWLINYSASHYKRAGERIKKLKRTILEELAKEGVRAKVDGRSKHLYSLWRKLLRPENERDINNIHDLMALRIITDDVKECYLALGLVHKLWHPVPHLGVRDWIAQPKPNGYRSIHTNVFLGDGQIVEIQIRTGEMHEQAEHGAAAHWYLAEIKSKNKINSEGIDRGNFFSPSEKMAWVQQLAAWQDEIIDSGDFIASVKFDALKHRIFVFSPKGDAFDLPDGATPVDFAYTVHTKMGHQACGAKVNGRMVSLDYHLKNGEIIEILVDRNRKKPASSWLDFAKTRLAQRKIKAALKFSI
ncbi:MAG: RelA/SpoT family protein [Candidatus Shapirobacteria bacterium]|nr:RelA/SpoT family protein [Candidatus Shapirobacteria bacterium]